MNNFQDIKESLINFSDIRIYSTKVASASLNLYSALLSAKSVRAAAAANFFRYHHWHGKLTAQHMEWFLPFKPRRRSQIEATSPSESLTPNCHQAQLSILSQASSVLRWRDHVVNLEDHLHHLRGK